MKFRKKPIVVDAEQFFPTKKPFPLGVEEYIAEMTESLEATRNTYYKWRIKTLEGWFEVSPKDWIITGVNGEKYPCKPDIFEKTYDKV
jgi:hypothetical protein